MNIQQKELLKQLYKAAIASGFSFYSNWSSSLMTSDIIERHLSTEKLLKLLYPSEDACKELTLIEALCTSNKVNINGFTLRGFWHPNIVQYIKAINKKLKSFSSSEDATEFFFDLFLIKE